MSDASTIETENNETDEFVIDVNKIGSKKPHDGKHITKIEISPKEEYLVTYSDDDQSIIGWDVKDEDDLKPGLLQVKLDSDEILYHMAVSDDKKLAYINNHEYIGINDMNNINQKIKLDCDDVYNYNYCTFNLKGELILCEIKDNIIFTYSTQTKNNKWNCKRMYKVPEDFNFINITKYNKLYLFSKNSVYEHDLITEKSKRIFKSEEEIKYSSYDKNIRITCNEKLICIRINDKLIIYSIELEIPFATLDINNDVQLHDFMCRFGLIPSSIPLLSGIIKECYWNECLDCLEKKCQLSKEYCLPDKIRITTKYAFGIRDGHIWKIKLEILAKMILNFKIYDENIIEYFDYDSKKKFKTCESLNIHLIIPYMDSIRALFDEISDVTDVKGFGNKIIVPKSTQNLIKWKIEVDDRIIKIKVYDKNSKSSWTRDENINVKQNLLGAKLIDDVDDVDIIVLTTKGLFIYHFNENNKSISLSYFYYMEIDYMDDINKLKYKLSNYKELFSGSTLPLSNDSFKYDNWVSYIKDNKECLLKYGVELLTFAIREHNLDLIEDIYKKCMDYFKEDLRNNWMFLSIITSTMPLLNRYYPDYILKYSSETTLITDSSSYSKEYIKNNNLHLYSFFQYPQVINLSRSIWWCKHNILMSEFGDNHPIMYFALIFIQILIILPILFIYAVIYYMLSTYHFIIHNIKGGIFKHTTTPTIIFMNPYIKFSNYPRDYTWYLELIMPKSSPFVETISKDIYKTWNGETLIDFKWNKYGKYYYTLIWIGYTALLICFTAAATIPQQYIDDNTQKRLLITSSILGFIHLSFEVRQCIHDPNKWIHNIWNLFDLVAFLLSICTPIYWLKTNNRDIQLLSFTCLFLDIKFLLFFRVFESFGIYFAIIISVGKQIASFLVVLFIIIISFAHTFYILLSPNPNFSFEEYTNNSDPNNPWNIAPSYHQVFDNGSINPDPYMIQLPSGNTNMFVDFGTSIFAMYKFLTGDPSALSNWSYKDDPSLVVLIVAFSLLVVVYLMNLFIGLLNKAIDKDNNKASYLIEKAEILVEIELFYLLPYQRRWHTWFPEVIYYYADVDEIRKKVKEMINEGEWNTNELLELKRDLLDKLHIQHDITLQQILEAIRLKSQDNILKHESHDSALQEILKEIRDSRSNTEQGKKNDNM
ncbi:hypothetical protein GLOIN_2v1768207 [Rhizophagus clarus]|uniref:Ion transport domain-containing protein n=1 Tax=Rhizophagus clarus TaxID=94130 RepID=A0A8H3QYI2_9GLOM|nr:hypothetical protein GLOIN_2v1768207 [Rhizophagus clarus]